LPRGALRAKAGCALASTLTRAGETERAETRFLEAQAELARQPHSALQQVFCLKCGSEIARERGDVKTALDRIESAQRVLKQSRVTIPVMELRLAMDAAECQRMAGHNREAA